MFYRVIIIGCFLFLVTNCLAQNPTKDSLFLIELNQKIETLVVNADTFSLQSLYAKDFVFSHGSGRIDNKASWLNSVSKGNFIQRIQDSVKAELHSGWAVLKGKLSVQRKGKDKPENYYLYYVRVYVLTKKQWQLASHTTYAEFHPVTQ